MIPKSGHRFSDEIMLHQKSRTIPESRNTIVRKDKD